MDGSSMVLSSGDAFPLRNITFLIVFVRCFFVVVTFLVVIVVVYTGLLLNLLLLVLFLLPSSTSELTSTVVALLWTESNGEQNMEWSPVCPSTSNRWGSSLGLGLMIYGIEFSSRLENRGMFGRIEIFC